VDFLFGRGAKPPIYVHIKRSNGESIAIPCYMTNSSQVTHAGGEVWRRLGEIYDHRDFENDWSLEIVKVRRRWKTFYGVCALRKSDFGGKLEYGECR